MLAVPNGVPDWTDTDSDQRLWLDLELDGLVDSAAAGRHAKRRTRLSHAACELQDPGSVKPSPDSCVQPIERFFPSSEPMVQDSILFWNELKWIVVFTSKGFPRCAGDDRATGGGNPKEE